MADATFSMTAVTPTTVDRTDLLARLRVELHDEDSNNYRWTDATLQRHLERAVRELSQVWPRERLSTLTATAGSRDIDVAFDGLVRIEAVEWLVDQDPIQYVQWSLYADVLTLLGENVPSDADDVNVYWGALHVLDDAQSTLPTVTEEAVVQGAAGYAALEWANYAINRANVGGDQVQADYRRWAEAHIELFNAALQEFGKRARVRTSGLFAPVAGPMGRDVVRWE
jgi:hypothetical protein